MSSASNASMRQFPGRMARKLAWLVLPLQLIPHMGVGIFLLLFGGRYLSQLTPLQVLVIFLAFLVSLSLSIWLGWKIIQRITLPLSELIEVIGLFFEGNWEQRYVTDRNDEAGELSYWFNRMANQLVETHKALGAAREQPSGPTVSGARLQTSTPPAQPSQAADIARKAELQALNQLSKLVNSSSSLEDRFTRALEIILKGFNCRAVIYYWIEEKEGALQPVLEQFVTAPEPDRQPAAAVKSTPQKPENSNRSLRQPEENQPALQPDALALVRLALLTRQVQIGPVPVENLGESLQSAIAVELQKAPLTGKFFEAAIPVCLEKQTLAVIQLLAPALGADGQLTPFLSNSINNLQIAAGLFTLLLLPVKLGASSLLPVKTTPTTARPQDQPTPPVSGPPALPPPAAAMPSLRSGAQAEIQPSEATASAAMIYRLALNIAQSRNEEAAIHALSQSMQLFGYPSALLITRLTDQGKILTARVLSGSAMTNASTPIVPLRQVRSYFSTRQPVLWVDPTLEAPAHQAMLKSLNSQPSEYLPEGLLNILRTMKCYAAMLIPIGWNEPAPVAPSPNPEDQPSPDLIGLLVIGSTVADSSAMDGHSANNAAFSPSALPVHLLSPFTTLANTIGNTLMNFQEQRSSQRQLLELQTLTQVAQTISMETDPNSLYRIIHQQVLRVMGEVDSMAIALYDSQSNTITIPYMAEEDKILHIDPFPLGEGLTSIVVRTHQPLMLVEDTERQSQLLGAKMIGAPARSWLGVPLLVGGEILGAMIVQDIHKEHRFTTDDLRLLSTLASQVAVFLRNAHLLQATRRLAEQERSINAITARIRSAVDLESILKTTAEELGKSLGARRAHIELSPQGLQEPHAPPPGNGGEPVGSDEKHAAAPRSDEI